MHRLRLDRMQYRLLAAAAVSCALTGCSSDTPGGPGVSGLRQVVAPPRDGQISQPLWSPDGKLLAYLRLVTESDVTPEEQDGLKWFERAVYRAHSGEESVCHFSLWVVPSEGGTPRQIKSSLPDGSLCGGVGLAWAPDSSALVYTELLGATPRDTTEKRTREPQGQSGCRLHVRAVEVADGTERQLLSLEIPCSSRFQPLGEAPLTMNATGTELVLFGYDGSTGNLRVAVISLQDSQFRETLELPTGKGSAVLPNRGLAWHKEGRLYYTRSLESSDPETGAGRCWSTTDPPWWNAEVWSVDRNGGSGRRETAGPSDCHPSPAPTGERLAFVRLGSIFLREADGTVRSLVERGYGGTSGFCDGTVAWSPDGRNIAFVWDVEGNTSLWTASVSSQKVDQTPSRAHP
jgi:dipeptidyl aminopeptidase/acylaminoacyl peptidase